jgi:hypothetical protein
LSFDYYDFFSVITEPLLVRNGQDGYKLPKGQHNRVNVHREMMIQIVRECNSLPDYRTMSFGEIRFWYDALRPSLIELTKKDG